MNFIVPFFLLGYVVVAFGMLTGAFGAHGLKKRVSAEKVAAWETAAHYSVRPLFRCCHFEKNEKIDVGLKRVYTTVDIQRFGASGTFNAPTICRSSVRRPCHRRGWIHFYDVYHGARV